MTSGETSAQALAPVPRGALPPYTVVELVVVAALVGSFLLLTVPPLRFQSGAYDEGPHILCGYQYLTSHVFSGGIGNPPLAQTLVALPAFLRRDAYRPFDESVLPSARTAPLALAVITALLVWRGGRRHAGRLAGVFGLLLFVFEPTVLAHSTLATVDMIATAGATLATYALWRAANRPTARAILAAGILLGLALLTKYSVLSLLPAWIIAFFWPFRPERRADHNTPSPRYGARVAALLIVLLIAYAVVGTGFLWRGIFHPAPPEAHGLLRVAAPFLPAPLVTSVAEMSAHAAGGHFAYLAGHRSDKGFVQYFLVALSLKWTLPFLLILSTGGVLLFWRRRVPAMPEMFLLLPPVVLFAFLSIGGHVDIGVRHMLPVVPLLAELGGVTAAYVARWSRWALVGVLACLALHVASALSDWPHELAYFNVLAGGTRGGDRFLIDSNIDWGTDEGALARALAADTSLVLLPDPREPGRGKVVVNVNALRGLFDLEGDRYWWLADLPPSRLITPAWRVFDLGEAAHAPKHRARSPGAPRDVRAMRDAVRDAALAPTAEAARARLAPILADSAAFAADDAAFRRAFADAWLIEGRARRAVGDADGAVDAWHRAASLVEGDGRAQAEIASLAAEDERLRGNGARAAYFGASATTLRGVGENASPLYRRALGDPVVRAAAQFGLALEAVRAGALERADSLLRAGAKPVQGDASAYAASVRAALARRHSSDAADHVELARWLTDHGAFDSAFDEAEVALTLDPSSADAIAMLSNLSINEKAGLLFMQRLGANRGFRLSELRRRARTQVRIAWTRGG
jgi:tetratricopeptide (TPR) repeat protein